MNTFSSESHRLIVSMDGISILEPFRYIYSGNCSLTVLNIRASINFVWFIRQWGSSRFRSKKKNMIGPHIPAGSNYLSEQLCFVIFGDYYLRQCQCHPRLHYSNQDVAKWGFCILLSARVGGIVSQSLLRSARTFGTFCLTSEMRGSQDSVSSTCISRPR